MLEMFAASTINVIVQGRGLAMSPGALELMNRAQIYQDRGVPWGQALDRAVAEVEAQCALQEAMRYMIEKDYMIVKPTTDLKDLMIEAKSWQLTSA
jgi:hypothetical protein